MKIIEENIFLRNGEFGQSEEFKLILKELNHAISLVTWNHDVKFIINPVKWGNGVTPIKQNFVKYLISVGWEAEVRMKFLKGKKPGPIDVIKRTKFGVFAVEWETGNISSSHRALNKITVGIIQKSICGGILVVPSKILARWLTDRCGNYEELEPYFPMYEHLIVDEGVLGLISVEHDELSNEVPFIPKGQDGNGKKKKKKLEGTIPLFKDI